MTYIFGVSEKRDRLKIQERLIQSYFHFTITGRRFRRLVRVSFRQKRDTLHKK